MEDVVVERRKRSGDEGGDSASKRRREEADVDDDILAWLSIDDETSTTSTSNTDPQLMELLAAAAEKEEGDSCPSGAAAAAKVRFMENPYASAFIFQTTPSSYVTINGNEESCGSSFSDWSSSVMASVDTGGAVFGFGFGSQTKAAGIGFEEVEQWLDGGVAAEMGGAWGSSEEGLLDWDEDDSLARVLGEIFSEQSVA